LKEYIINFYLNVSVRYLAETKRYDYALKALNEIKKIAPAHPNIESIKNNIEKQSGK